MDVIERSQEGVRQTMDVIEETVGKLTNCIIFANKLKEHVRFGKTVCQPCKIRRRIFGIPHVCLNIQLGKCVRP